MAGTFDTQIRRTSVLGAKEIKASTNYAYIQNGITLDGSKFAVGATVLEGQCLVKDNASGKYEPYADSAGAFPAGKSNPVILDQSVKLDPKVDGTNPDVVCGQVLVRGDVYKGQLVSWTQIFQDKLAGAIRIL